MKANFQINHEIIDMKNTITSEEIQHILAPHIGSDIHITELETFAQKHQAQGQTLILRDAEDQPVSFLLFEEQDHHININMMWTKTELRQKGLMQRFIHELIDTTDKSIHVCVPHHSVLNSLFDQLQFKKNEHTDNTDSYIFSR